MAQDNPPAAPVQHHYTVQINRQAGGAATYTLLQDGKPVPGFVGVSGGWDDTTPWPNGTYVGTYNGAYGEHPSWRFDPAFSPKRTGILLHTNFDSRTPSKPSVGCAVAPPTLLDRLDAMIKQDNIEIQAYNALVQAGQLPGAKPVLSQSRNVSIAVSGEEKEATITLSASVADASSATKAGNSDTFVKLQVGLTKPLSKDVWVFVKVDNPDDPNHRQFTKDNINKSVLVLDSNGRLATDPGGSLNVGAGVRAGNVGYQLDITGDKGGLSRNPADRSQNGFWVRIPAQQTAVEVHVKPAYNNTVGTSRTETFTVADYGIVYNGNSSRSPSLYQDGLNSPDARLSNLLTGGQRTGASVGVVLTDELTSAGTLGSVFVLPPAPGGKDFRYPHAWTFDVDPDKSHTFTVGWTIGADEPQNLRLVIQTLDGGKKALKYKEVSSGDGYRTYSIDQKDLQGTEGQITIQGTREDPHGFTVVVDNGVQQQILPPNLIQLPNQEDQLQVNFTPGGTGTPSSTTIVYGDDGSLTITTTDAAGNVIYREIDNVEGTREVERYQIAGQPYTSSDRMYDANGNVTSTTLYNDDGTPYLSGVGILNADGTTTVSLVDASGVIGGFEVDYQFLYPFYQSGPKAVTLYVNAGQPFPAVESDYDLGDNLRSRKFFNAIGEVYKTETLTYSPDGRIVSDIYDASGALIETKVTGIQGQPYAATDTTYDSSGNIVLITRYAADGSVYETGTVTVDSNGTATTTYNDASGALIEQDVLNADGSKQISLFNIAGLPYASSITDYDIYGGISAQVLYYAGGVIYQSTAFDPITLITTILTYNASGNLTSKEVDNGLTRDITTYGITDQPYNSLEVVYNFFGELITKTLFNIDGTKEIIDYPDSVNSVVTTTDSFYDVNGYLNHQTIYDSDGSVALTKTVIWNADGSSTIQVRNGAGLLTSQEVHGADGSRAVIVYGVPGETLPSTENIYDASQKLLSTTVINADASKSVMVFGIVDQIYTRKETFYDPSGAAIAQNFFDPYGLLVQSDTITHGADGSTTTRFFNEGGALTIQQVDHADGSVDVTDYGDGGIPYVKSVSHLGASGALTSETLYNRDGSVQQTKTVTQNADGSSTTDVNDAVGNLINRTIMAADGSSEVLIYGPATSIRSDTSYGATGNIRSATVYNDDGSVSETESVTVNADGSTTVSVFNPAGALVQQSIENADGSGITTVYGITDASYYSIVEVTDTDGVVVSDTYLNSDGTRDVVTFPASGPYSQVDSHYDVSGVLIGKDLFDYSGAIALIGTITANLDGSVTTRYVDSSGALSQVEVDRADGTSSITRHGVSGEPYTSAQTDYDAVGSVVSVNYFNADGSIYQTETVTTSPDDGSTTLNFYDATGTLVLTEVDAADGSFDIAIFGITGQSYTSSHSQYDASGALFFQTRNYADGTRDVLNYRISDLNFSTADSHYDASGQLLTRELLRADGSTYLVGTATTDSSGVITIDYLDGSTNLLRQETENPDGSREVRIFQITGQPYTSTDTFYYGPDNAGVETFYKSDQSVYRTGYFSFNSDGSGYETFYGSDSRFQEEDTFFSDGSKRVSLSNVPEQYASTNNFYNADGSLTSSDITYIDGSSRADVFGVANEPYASTSTLYDFYGQLTSVTRRSADGSVYQVGTPAASQEVGTFTMDYVNAAGVLASVETLRINGTSSVITYLITGQPYASTVRNYNESGSLTSETYLKADGSNYSSTRSVYDASGNLVAKAFFKGDGSVDRTVYVSNGVTTTDYFDANGGLDHKTIVNSDGTNSLIEYGAAGELYASTKRDYDASGTLTQLTSFKVDGSRDVDVYGIAGQPFVRTRSEYAASGNLTSEAFYKPDGAVYLVENVEVNADGSTTTTVSDDTSSVIYRSIGYAEGGGVDYAYGIIGEPYASTVSNYDVNGSLTSAMFYAADGSLYQAEIVSTDMSGVTTTTLTNADGSLASTNIVAADGSSVLTVYGIVGGPFTSMASIYDGNGSLTFETFYNEDGSIYETKTVTETVNPDGSTTVTYVSSDGSTETYTYNADGTLETPASMMVVSEVLANEADGAPTASSIALIDGGTPNIDSIVFDRGVSSFTDLSEGSHQRYVAAIISDGQVAPRAQSGGIL